MLICKKNLQGSAYCAPNIYNTAIYLRITVRASLSLSAAMPKMQTHARAEERASSLLNLAVGVKFEKCCYKFTSVVRLWQEMKSTFPVKRKRRLVSTFLISLKRSRIVCERFFDFQPPFGRVCNSKRRRSDFRLLQSKPPSSEKRT